MKILIRILLGLSVCLMTYLCVVSVVTPIKFERIRSEREPAVIANLIDLRTAAVEFRSQYGHYTDSMDSLLNFVKTGKKKEVLKEGALTDKQLEAGMTEPKAVKIIKAAKDKVKKMTFESEDALYDYIWANDKDIVKNSLQGFRRDTIATPLLDALYKGKHTAESIDKIAIIPYSNGLQYKLEVNNSFTNKNGVVPLFQASAAYETYLGDLNQQELVNLQDKEKKLGHFPGLKVGSIEEPNNNAGNWE
ncbi:MAG: hypothetical protein IJS05_05065 [Paludibacteraceae bacterium]|nr:hypothetical protein [Paludibacteraceae bacterium]